MRQITREWNQYITNGFTEEEIATVKALLDRVSERATTYAQRELTDDPDEEIKGENE